MVMCSIQGLKGNNVTLVSSTECSGHPKEQGHQGVPKLALCYEVNYTLTEVNYTLAEVNQGLKFYEPHLLGTKTR